MESLSDRYGTLRRRRGGEICAVLEVHGQGHTSNDILPEHVALIKELYPNDQATGYKVNQLRGMWSVVFNKKEFITNM